MSEPHQRMGCMKGDYRVTGWSPNTTGGDDRYQYNGTEHIDDLDLGVNICVGRTYWMRFAR